MAEKSIEPFAPIASAKPAKRGETQEELKPVQDFLNRFGYVKDKAACQQGVLDDETASALGKYQNRGMHFTPDYPTSCGWPVRLPRRCWTISE